LEKKFGNLKIIVAADYDGLSATAADIIAGQIAAKPDSVLGLATGSTPIGTYRALVEKHKAGLDFSRITSFNLDEYFPIKQSNDQSYMYFMRENLFAHVNINPANINIPSGEVADAKAECAAYEAKIAVKGLDLQLLGVGNNGHIGFNEPCDFFPKTTHHTALAQSTIDANARFFESTDDVPKHALTMGIGTIFQAKRILMVASGAGKADIMQKLFFGPITPQVPGSILQLHPDVTLVVDKDAATKLEGI